MCKSLSKERSHIISRVTFTMDLYSASAEDQETVNCFFNFQDIRESPRNTQKSLMDLRVSRQDAQSEYASALVVEWTQKSKTNPVQPCFSNTKEHGQQPAYEGLEEQLRTNSDDSLSRISRV